MTRLTETLERGQNNFDLIRLAAALTVAWSHNLVMYPKERSIDPVASLLKYDYSGAIAVYTFFLISGMLITQSFNRSASPFRFVLNRFLRIWPAFAVATIVTYFVIVPLSNDVNYVEFVTSPFTIACVKANLTMLAGICPGVPGIFMDSAIPGGANYSIWSVLAEIHCYMLIFCLGMAGLLASKGRGLFAIAASTAAFFVIVANPPAPEMAAYHNDFAKLGGYSFYAVAFFLFGAALYLCRDHIRIDGRFAILLFVIYYLARGTFAELPVLYLAIAYGVLYLAAAKGLRRLAPKNDYSYGLYIYACPIMQAVYAIFPTLEFWSANVLITVLSCLIAAASWHIIEKPCLSLGRFQWSQRFRILQSGTS